MVMRAWRTANILCMWANSVDGSHRVMQGSGVAVPPAGVASIRVVGILSALILTDIGNPATDTVDWWFVKPIIYSSEWA